MNITLQIPALDNISICVTQLVEIQAQRLLLEQKNMIQASDVTKLIGLYDALVTTDASDQAATAAVQAKLDALTASVAEFNDPALQTALTAALANAVAVTPPATPPVVPVTPPVVDPNATNPDGSLVSGNVTNPDGSVTTTAGTVIPAPAPVPATA